MDQAAIRAKFGDDYVATEKTYHLGIDIRLASAVARRFADLRVLETCTGAGFTTIALARVAAHVTTIEIDPEHQEQARRNVDHAGLSGNVTFVAGDVLSPTLASLATSVDAAFLDPDWAVSGPDHRHRFLQSNMKPPADALLEAILRQVASVALILPVEIDLLELEGLPQHERQSLYLEGRHALYCLYFGALTQKHGASELRT
jgi:tRNA1(Val) A37 N6-methylase TrmN6